MRPNGEVAERLIAPVLKTGDPSRGSWVRIPPSPPTILALDPGKGEPVGDLLGHSITYRVEMRPRTGQKVFTPGACRRGRSESTTSPLPKRPASHCTRA